MSPPDGKEQAEATILLAEDEQTVRSFVLSLLTRTGYNVITAVDGMDALQKARNHNGTIELLLSDVQMPGMTGVELATQFSIDRPATKILLMSGLPSGMILLNEGWHFLPKPFMMGMLKSKIKEMLSKTSEFSEGVGK
jgi:two-component system cell cycle sensor histidine kinase/response regulator CckA